MHNVMAGKLGSRSARVFPSFLVLVSVAACLYPTCSNKLDIDVHICFMTFSSSEEAQAGTSSFQYARCLNELKIISSFFSLNPFAHYNNKKKSTPHSLCEQ